MRSVGWWRAATLGTLFTGYAGYYVCRSNLSVASPLLLDDPSLGLSKSGIGLVSSAGVTAYAIGKVTNGLLADATGGRLLFLLGMFASVVCTIAFGLSAGLGAFVVVWVLNRYVQSMGWVSLVKVSSRWFPLEIHATVLGILSMSYLLGDAVARFYLGSAIGLGLGWRGVFMVSATTLGIIAAIGVFTLKASPEDVGGVEPPDSPEALYQGHTEARVGRALLTKPSVLFGHLKPLLSSPPFWLICGMNVGLTLVRETFLLWTPTFLYEVAGLSAARSAVGSLLFPLVGSAAALAAGVASDRLGGMHGRVVLPCLGLLTLALLVLSASPVAGRPGLALVLIGCVAFVLLAPYSYYSGVMALDLGGRRGSATASGLIDSAGYLGAILSGYGIGSLAEAQGWGMAFRALAVVALATGALGAVYWLHQERTRLVKAPAPVPSLPQARSE